MPRNRLVSNFGLGFTALGQYEKAALADSLFLT